MKVFELSNSIWKNRPKTDLNPLKSITGKQALSIGFLIIVVLFYFSDHIFNFSRNDLENNTNTMKQYGAQLESNLNSISGDTILLKKEREHVLRAIDERVVTFLYKIPDYSYVKSLESYFEYAPQLLDQIPSAVPLEKGDYTLSSKFGIRQHPISGKKRKHNGIDLAATSDNYVYASAVGNVTSVIYDENGYGTHIIIKHRFGFETLYGHLNKVLVHKGQKIEQHELIATVGNSGSSTGYHLHYEVIKNSKKIDPVPSLNLKYRVITIIAN